MSKETTKPEPSGGKVEAGSDDGISQRERFMKVARELETDDDPERFADRVRRLAKAQIPAPADKVSG